MNIWHLTPDADRIPHRVSPNDLVTLRIGTWPVEPGQSVWVKFEAAHSNGGLEQGQTNAVWQRNQGENSYWEASIGPFSIGDRVAYRIGGHSFTGDAEGPANAFSVGPKTYLAFLWHHHQPIYKDTSRSDPKGSYLYPWVRLHAIRDYYSMAALVAEHPNVHVTINLTPSLLWQIEDYVVRGATDRALDLTLKPATRLTKEEREEMLSSFFDSHWHNQIFPHPRYKELFEQRLEERRFTFQDLRDLQMWFNLAWFAKEFREGEVQLITGDLVSVRPFVEQGRNFKIADIRALVDCQYKVLRAVVSIHKEMQDRGQIELSTTPFFHPILPILIDSDRATIDRPGATHPPRFAQPDDADAQVKLAVDAYTRWFGRSPRGMWPAEGAVGQAVVPFFARNGVRWIATDQGVLARSGRYGYSADHPDVLCQPYRVQEEQSEVTVFFRNTQLSDAIGFRYHGYHDYKEAANDFLNQIRALAGQYKDDADRVLSVILDGENAWGDYREDARPFLHALYGVLESDKEIQSVTFSEYLEGNVSRNVKPHPVESQERVHDLFTGSWIDENSSAPGVDLGTWIGEEEENHAWEFLRETRLVLAKTGATPAEAQGSFQSIYMAEGSDWFWWYGADQESGNDEDFDDLFRIHLKNVYRGLGKEPPLELDRHIVPRTVKWTFTNPVRRIQPGDRLTICTNCPGILTWRVGEGEQQEAPLGLAGGVMAGVQHHHITLRPFTPKERIVLFSFRCTHQSCDGRGVCCKQQVYEVEVASPGRVS